jgi:hypothetical protein
VQILKVERNRGSGPETVSLLLEVESRSSKGFLFTEWSCVLLDNKKPVWEDKILVQNVPARSRVISRGTEFYKGAFDEAQCRFMNADNGLHGSDLQFAQRSKLGELFPMKILKVERSGGFGVSLLLEIENRSSQGYKYTHWSCVLLDNKKPVWEEKLMALDVPAHSQVISRVTGFYDGAFDEAECRFMNAD